MDKLAVVLEHEREALEELVYRVTVLRQLIVAGEAAYVARASDEVERATVSVHELELRRALVVSQYAEETGCDEESLTMRRLSVEAAEPWRTVFADIYASFLKLTADLEDGLVATGRLARSGLAAIDEISGRLGRARGASAGGPGATYRNDATVDTGAPRQRVLGSM